MKSLMKLSQLLQSLLLHLSNRRLSCISWENKEKGFSRDDRQCGYPLMSLLAKPRQSVVVPTASFSQGTSAAAVPSPVTSTPRKGSSRQVSTSEEEWL